MPLLSRVYDTPFGQLAVIVDPAAQPDRPAPVPGAVVASGFGSVADLSLPAAVEGADPLLDLIGEAVSDWVTGSDPAALERVPVLMTGTGFRSRAWEAMRTIPSGQTVTYLELAELAGSPKAARAAGSACATNRVAPFVPCHRVVPSSGGPGHYGYGRQQKAAMLTHEKAAT